MVRVTKSEILSDISSISPDTTLSEFCESVEYSRSVVLDRFGTWANAKREAGISVSGLVCPNCSVFCEYVSNHWNNCGEPDLSDKQKSLLRGMLLSDGTITGDSQFTIYNSNRQFLEWLSSELSFMAYPPVLNDRGTDRHERNIRSGFDSRRDAEYKDMFACSVPKHSFVDSLHSWYDSGSKEIPRNLSIDDTILRMWYCGDGGLNWSNENKAYAEIRAMSFDNSTIHRLFDSVDIDYSVQDSGTICFYGDTENFLSKIGPSPSGMEYKWEFRNRDRYRELKP